MPWCWLAQQTHPAAASGVRRVHKGRGKVLYKTVPSAAWPTLDNPSEQTNDLQLCHGRNANPCGWQLERALPRWFLCRPCLLFPHLLCHKKRRKKTGGDIIPTQGVRKLCTLLEINIFLACGEAGGADRQRGGVGAVPGCPP